MERKIEGSYPSGATPLDDYSGLIPEHVETLAELYELEFANINKILPKYFLKRPSKKTAPFTREWLFTLHLEMLGEVWEWAGSPRKTNKNIGVDKHHIPSELEKFLGDYHAWREHSHDPIEISAKIHHRLVWIHPFENGNGRWARMVSNIFLWQNEAPIVQWPEDQFFVDSVLRERYISALKKADNHDYLELINLHTQYCGK